jgi:hypothetical protein
MLSNAPGFRALYASREVHFEEIYADILDPAYRARLRGKIDPKRKRLLRILDQHVGGNIILDDEAFVMSGPEGNLEFTLLAEGLRKLGLLWLLIQNGTLLKGAALFWDEPETNLNPSLFGIVVEVLLELQRNDVQIFLATHDYVFLKELDLRSKKKDKIVYHSIFRDGKYDAVQRNSTDEYLFIDPNMISQTFSNLYDRDLERFSKS